MRLKVKRAWDFGDTAVGYNGAWTGRDASGEGLCHAPKLSARVPIREQAKPTSPCDNARAHRLCPPLLRIQGREVQ